MAFIKLPIIFGIILICNSLDDIPKLNANSSVENLKVDIYYLNPLYNDYIKMPDDFKTFYQIEGGENGTYSIIKGSTAQINQSGTITPVGNYNGETIIKCIVQGNEFNITVNTHDYSMYYTEKNFTAYANTLTNINSSYEKFENITKYISHYPFKDGLSNFFTMVVVGCGDIFAYSYAIEYLAQKVGLNVKLRSTDNDEDHKDSPKSILAIIDNEYYVAKIYHNSTSGQNTYNIYKIPYGYSYRNSPDIENGILIYQYDGTDSNIIIPEQLDNKKVVGIAEKCFANGIGQSNIINVTIPETVKSIGDYAFHKISGLKKLVIPKSVESIGIHVLEESKTIEEIIVDEANPKYASDNGILVSKNKDTIIIYPSGRKDKEFRAKDSLKIIANYSFTGNKNLKKLYFPKSITDIGKEALMDTEIKEIFFEGEPPVFGDGVFTYVQCNISYYGIYRQWENIKRQNLGDLVDITWIDVYDYSNTSNNNNSDSSSDNNSNSPVPESNSKSYAVTYVFIGIGCFIIIGAIIAYIIIKKKSTSSSNIETLTNDGLIDKNNFI